MACETEQGQRYDCMGLPVTCDSDEALKWFNKSLAALSSRHESPMPMCTRACELDKSLVLAHCLVVRYLVASGEKNRILLVCTCISFNACRARCGSLISRK